MGTMEEKHLDIEKILQEFETKCSERDACRRKLLEETRISQSQIFNDFQNILEAVDKLKKVSEEEEEEQAQLIQYVATLMKSSQNPENTSGEAKRSENEETQSTGTQYAAHLLTGRDDSWFSTRTATQQCTVEPLLQDPGSESKKEPQGFLEDSACFIEFDDASEPYIAERPACASDSPLVIPQPQCISHAACQRVSNSVGQDSYENQLTMQMYHPSPSLRCMQGAEHKANTHPESFPCRAWVESELEDA